MIKLSALIADLTLKHHQQEGSDKALQNDGNVLFDWKVGSGKTLGSIAAFERLRKHNKASTALVVTPSQLKDNYLTNGIHRFTDSRGTIIGNSSETKKPHTIAQDKIEAGNSDYYIISNEMFRKQPQYFLDKTKADTVIIDEIQKYRDPYSKNYQEFMKVRPNIRNVIGMTGTPFSNKPEDIIPILDVVTNRKHNLGNSSEFRDKFITKEKYKTGPLSFMGIGTDNERIKIKNPDELKYKLNKHISTYHEDEKDMPDKVIKDVNVPMSKDQSEVYNWVMHNHINPLTYMKVKYNLPVDQKESKNIFEALIKARQASNSLHLFKKGMTLSESAQQTPKMKQVIDDTVAHLKENPKNKVILYSNFLHGGVDVLSQGLKDQGIEHGTFTGTKTMSLKDRAESVSNYLSGKHRAIILNQAGAEGLNLPGTTAHFALDGHFNPAMIEQSEARGIRAGSPVDKVVVHRYKTVMPETFLDKYLGANFKPLKMIKGYSTDEWVYETARRKKELNDKVQEMIG